ncbi:hypothetical protein AB833_28495 [Chromatiales bacterium (ex Bugula neritina AB1)]|nr:hypothetical protein AB833_28495 [Chromatiales bacterium (ex Bugula neritina AB1)]
MIVAPFSTATEGIEREASLFKAAQKAVLIWQAKENALVVPAALARRQDMKKPMANSARAGWPVVTRGSGGGVVPQGPCTLNLAMVVPLSGALTIHDGYRLICDVVGESLTRFRVSSTTGACKNTFCDGDWNVLVGGRKFAGTAQRWRKTTQGHVALIHAAIMVQTPDLGLWPVIQQLHKVAQPEHSLPRAEAHVAMNEFMPGTINFFNFSNVLAREANSRLCLHERQESSAA